MANTVPSCGYTARPRFVYPSVGERLGRLHFGAAVNAAAVNALRSWRARACVCFHFS